MNSTEHLPLLPFSMVHIINVGKISHILFVILTKTLMYSNFNALKDPVLLLYHIFESTNFTKFSNRKLDFL